MNSYQILNQSFIGEDQVMKIKTDDIEKALDEIRAEEEANNTAPDAVVRMVELSQGEGNPDQGEYVVKLF